MKAPNSPPVIESEQQARDFGTAMNVVLHFDAEWAVRVFTSSPVNTYLTGPETLNKEVASMWSEYWTNDEKLKLLAHYTAAVLSR